MATRSRNLTIVAACLFLLNACSSKAPSSSAGDDQTATGKVIATGAFDFSSQSLRSRTRIAQEPYQETFALRLDFAHGSGPYRGLLVDIDDLPASVAGQYTFGDGVDADLNFLAADPNQSGSRFSIRDGQLEIRVSNGRASGTLRGAAVETTYAASKDTLDVTLQFDEVRIDDPES